MAHSKRDLINEQRAKAAEEAGAVPPYVDDPSKHLVGLLHEAGINIGPVTEDDFVEVPPPDADGSITIHNAEQISVLADLERLIHDTGAVIAMAKAVRDEDESLYRQDVEWDMVGCGHAERWIDDGGNLGWRVGINFADPSATKFMAYVASKLGAMGWDNVIAEAWGG